jgi:hypothetical protein
MIKGPIYLPKGSRVLPAGPSGIITYWLFSLLGRLIFGKSHR